MFHLGLPKESFSIKFRKKSINLILPPRLGLAPLRKPGSAERMKTTHGINYHLNKSLQMESLPDKFESIKKMRLELYKESDRGACLLSVSFLENQLELLLKKYLVNSNKTTINKVFENYGPLATFSSKIDMGFLLGLISKESFDDLNNIRKIRNEFAHSYGLIDFQNTKIRSICLSLKTHYREKTENPKDLFISTVCGIIGRLNSKEFTVIRVLEYTDKISLEDMNNTAQKNKNIILDNLNKYKDLLDKKYADSPLKEELIKEHVSEYIQDLFSALKPES